MNARELAELLADEMPSRKVIMDLGGLKVEVLDAELTTHEGEPAIELLASPRGSRCEAREPSELTPGPRDPDEDRALREIEPQEPFNFIKPTVSHVVRNTFKTIILPDD